MNSKFIKQQYQLEFTKQKYLNLETEILDLRIYPTANQNLEFTKEKY